MEVLQGLGFLLFNLTVHSALGQLHHEKIAELSGKSWEVSKEELILSASVKGLKIRPRKS